MLHVIENPNLPRDVGVRCMVKSPPVPYINEANKPDYMNLSCVDRKNPHSCEEIDGVLTIRHVACTQNEKGHVTWFGWTDRDIAESAVEEDL